MTLRDAPARRRSAPRCSSRSSSAPASPRSGCLAGDVGLQLLENSIATGAGLVALILAIGPVSGAHFNPVVTLADRLLGGTSTRDAGVYMVAQVVGGCAGAVVANLMFSLSAVSLSTHTRSSGALWLGEVVATFGLLLVILGIVRAGRSSVAAYAVGGYIAAAYWFTSSTSFANPAVTIARTLDQHVRRHPPGPARRCSSSCRSSARWSRWRSPVSGTRRSTPLISSHGARARRGVEMNGQAHVPEVLFVCVHNAGRSQMAAALLDHHAQGRVRVRSAGSAPGNEINPAVVAAMGEVGLDLSKEFPKPLTDESVQAADVVITMGCGDACPFYPGKRYLDWELEDPAGKPSPTCARSATRSTAACRAARGVGSPEKRDRVPVPAAG